MKNLNTKQLKYVYLCAGVVMFIGSAISFYKGGMYRGVNLALDTITENGHIYRVRDDGKKHIFSFSEVE